jgi:tRNA (guanosine-2'-O-)-methyltransferase
MRNAALLLLTVAACGGPPTLAPKNVATHAGTVLETACTPHGPELCFNAVDDNCNGVIDEGCGIGTGFLQFTIAWGQSPANVDLFVTDPAGTKVGKANRTSESGLRYERDCPTEGCHKQNLENVFFEGVEPARGRYVVDVVLIDSNGGDLPVVTRLSARVGNRTFSMEFRLTTSGGADHSSFTFEL